MKNKNYIFLHGGPGFSNYLKPFFQDLAVDGKLVFYDQLKGPETTIENLIQQLDEIVNNLEGDKILIGHSWGSTLGIEYVSRFESKISSLVLMCSGLNFKHWKIDFDLHKQENGLVDAPPENIFLSEKERGEWKGFLDGLWDSFSDETFESLFEGYIKFHDLVGSFSKLSRPILYINGSEDHRFPAKIAKKVASYNSSVEAFEVVDAGHFPFLNAENRKNIIQKIRDYTSK